MRHAQVERRRAAQARARERQDQAADALCPPAVRITRARMARPSNVGLSCEVNGWVILQDETMTTLTMTMILPRVCSVGLCCSAPPACMYRAVRARQSTRRLMERKARLQVLALQQLQLRGPADRP